MASQIVTMLMHLLIALLVLFGRIRVWHVFVTAFVSGGSMAFNQPARQALILAVPRPHTQRRPLNTAAMNTMRVLGVFGRRLAYLS